MRFACHGLSQQSLPRPWRANEERTLGDLPPELGVLGWVLEEVDDLFYFDLGFVKPGDVLEGDYVAFLLVELSLALAYAEEPASGHAATATTSATTEHEVPEDDNDDEGRYINKECQQARAGFLVRDLGRDPALVVEVREAVHRRDLCGEGVFDALLLSSEHGRLLSEDAIGSLLRQLACGCLVPAVDGDLGECAVASHSLEFIPAQGLAFAEATIPEEEPSEDCEDDRIDPELVEAEGLSRLTCPFVLYHSLFYLSCLSIG